MSIRLPAIERIPLGLDPADAAAKIDALGGRFTEGYLRADGPAGSAFLFVHQGVSHSAGAIEGDRFASASFGDFLIALRGATDVALCRTDRVALLATTALFRKPPSAQIPTSLITGGDLLHAIRQTGKDAVLVVRRAEARSLVFCREGEPVVLYPAEGEDLPESTVSERIVAYVLRHPETILDLYDEIHVPPADGSGRAPSALVRESLSAAAPTAEPSPQLVVRIGERVVFVHAVTGDRLTIGRGGGNDIALDNLSVSRKHAVLTRRGQTLIVEDLGSDNGLVVAGNRVPSVELSPGEEVSIGKYTLAYAVRDSMDVLEAPLSNPRPQSPVPIVETVMVGMQARPTVTAPSLEIGGRRYPLGEKGATIGRSPDASIRVDGFLVASIHLQVMPDGRGGFRAVHLAGWRAMRVNGRTARRTLLRAGDVIEVAGHAIRFDPGASSQRLGGG